MSVEAYKKFGKELMPGGTLLVDNSVAVDTLPDGIQFYHSPMVETAVSYTHLDVYKRQD